MQSKLCQKDLQQQQLERERALLHLRPSCQRLGGYNAAWWLQTATHVHNLGDGKRVQNLGHTAWRPAPQGPTCGLCPLVGVFIVLWGDLWLKNILSSFSDHHHDHDNFMSFSDQWQA